MVSDEERKKAYEIVYNDLIKCGLFIGKYDARHGKADFMCGVGTVMESIASGISARHHYLFTEEWNKNIIESEEKARLWEDDK
jgi:hypothetical protein